MQACNMGLTTCCSAVLCRTCERLRGQHAVWGAGCVSTQHPNYIVKSLVVNRIAALTPTAPATAANSAALD